MGNNFDFVESFSNELYTLAKQVENKLYSEPSSVLREARLFSEHLVKLISKEENLEEVYPLKHYERIHKLHRQEIIDEDTLEKLEWIRKKGNKAAHQVGEADALDAIHAHKSLFDLSVWYMQVYVSYTFEPPTYRLPENKTEMKGNDLKQIQDEVDRLGREMAQLQSRLTEDKEVIQEKDSSRKKQTTQPMYVEEEILAIFDKHDFKPTNKTKKAAEFTNEFSDEVIYLLPNKKLTIVLHPAKAKERFTELNEPRLSTAFGKFPKFVKDGVARSKYGYPFSFDQLEDLDHFLEILESTTKVSL